jgi:hypothetical protein
MSDLLLEIALDTGTKYFSIHNTSTDSQHYDGRIISSDDFKKMIRPGGGVSAIQTASFELDDSDGELKTLSDITTWKRRVVTAKLVLDDDSLVTVFTGRVERVTSTPSTFSIEARDDSWDVLRETIPLRVFPDIFADMPITTEVALIPIVIGTVSSASFDKRGAIPAYLIDPHETLSVYRYVAAQHGLKSITKVYSRGQEVDAGDWTTSYANITTDYGTVRMTMIDVDYDLRDENGEDFVTYDATGICVTPSDETSALETDIPDALKLMLSALQQTSPLVAGDFASTTAVATQYTDESITLSNNGMAVTEWGMTWLDVIDLFAESFNLQFYMDNDGKFAMRFDDAQAGTATRSFVDSQNILEGSFSLEAPDESVATLECSYAYDWARGRPTARKSYNDATEQTALGRAAEEEADLSCIRSINDAQKIAQIKLFQQRSSRQLVSVTVPAQDIDLGDFVTLTHFGGPSSDKVGFDATLFCVYEISLDTDGFLYELLLIDHPGLTIGSPADSEETRTTQTLSHRAPDIASDVVWQADDTNTVSWSSCDLKIGNALYTSIASGDTGNMSAKTYVFFDPDVNEAAFQTTTTFSDAVGVRRVLLAECLNGTYIAKIKNFVGWVETGVGGGGSDMPQQISYEEAQTDTLSNLSVDLGSITAGTVTGALIRTASSGQRIQLTSTAFETYDSGSTKRLEIPSTADKITFFDSNGTGRGSIYGDSANTAMYVESTAGGLVCIFDDSGGSDEASVSLTTVSGGGAAQISATDGTDTASINVLGTGASIGLSCDLLGFYGATPVAKQTVSGARDTPEEALADLLTELAELGLITDSTTAS